MNEDVNEEFLAGFRLALSMHEWGKAEAAGQCWQCFCGRQGLQHTNGPCRCTKAFKGSLFFRLMLKEQNHERA